MVQAPVPTRLALEIHFDSEPIEGRVRDDAGALDEQFCGWLGLLAALETARLSASPAASGEGRPA